MKIVELTNLSKQKFFLIGDGWMIQQGAKDSAFLVNDFNGTKVALEDRYSDLRNIYSAVTNPYVRKDTARMITEKDVQ